MSQETFSDWVESTEFSLLLGSGSYGVVLQAANALVIPADTALKARERDRVLREGQIMGDKKHPNIVATTNFAERILGRGDIENIIGRMKLNDSSRKVVVALLNTDREGPLDSIWIQMELCGQTLRTWLQKSKDSDDALPETQLGIVTGLIEGVKYLHANKIMHRDLKPENMYFSQGFVLPIKIGDFGEARVVQIDENLLTASIGTIDYRAPEADSTEYTFQVDLYSLGLVMWEILQLISVSNRRSLFDRLVNDSDSSLIQDHSLIVNCKEVISKLTRRKVKERMQSIQEVALQINPSS